MTWQDPALVTLRQQAERTAARLATCEQAWQALEPRTDFRADQERMAVRAQLPGLYATRDRLAAAIEVAETRETVSIGCSRATGLPRPRCRRPL
jgi:hypothetical protein